MFSPKGAGPHYYGPGISAYRMYEHLKRDNISVSLAHGYQGQAETKVFQDHFYISDLEKLNLLTGINFFLKAKKWVKNNARKFDVLHCLSAFHPSFLFAVWFEQMGTPSVIKISESKYTGFNESSSISNLLGLKKYRLKHSNLISGYISISSEIRNNLMSAGIEGHKIYDIPNGVDISRFKPVSEKQKKALRNKLGLDNKFTVLFTGSFSDRKNPYLIAKAFKAFANSDKIQLLLVGPDRDEGKQRTLIQKFIQENSIYNIYLIDFVEHIEYYYQASDIFVLPSNQEGLSNSMLEAQASGLPAIVTSISGAVDLIDEQENGIFTDRNEESVKNAIREYYTDAEKLRNHSLAARKKIVDNYSNEKILNEHLQLFEKLK
ncbi:MAG: glycosyltransferase family 4 protein [Balneolaceae bacterium]|nr:glycosyltransferase family 4 protein [Balneolaceae bacterium]